MESAENNQDNDNTAEEETADSTTGLAPEDGDQSTDAEEAVAASEKTAADEEEEASDTDSEEETDPNPEAAEKVEDNTESEQPKEEPVRKTRDLTVGEGATPPVVDGDEDSGWYILQVRGGREEKIKEQIQQKLLSEGEFDLINEISVPKEKVSKIKGGERTVHEKKLFPGYVLVNMNMNEHARYIIKNVRGVYQFLGEEEPRKLSREEVEQMLAPTKEEEEKPKVEIEFEVGDTVRIKEGPFENMEGNVEELLPEKGLVRLTVTIFGRATPVELEYWQLESI